MAQRDLEPLALRIANEYLNRLRSLEPNHRPWGFQPVQETKVFMHFLKAAEVVEEMQADPKVFITAQFEHMQKWKRSKYVFPWPSQLWNENARLKYIQYVGEQRQRAETLALPQHEVTPYAVLEQKKLTALCKKFKLPEREVLIMMHAQFSDTFLESKGALVTLRQREG